MPLPKELLLRIIEALLFVSTEPISLDKIMQTTESGKTDVSEALSVLKNHYGEDRGVQFVEIAGGYQFVTQPETSEWIRRLTTVKKSGRLSKAGNETLAIVAYKQPVVRDEVEKIRGVDCGGVLRTLLERGLIRIIGRKHDSPGAPILYGTTKDFLKYYGLNNLADLPTLKDFSPEDIQETVADRYIVEMEHLGGKI